MRVVNYLLSVTFALLATFSSSYAESEFTEGKHYTILTDKKATTVPTVYEFFSYNCPHCMYTEPKVHAFLETKPNEAAFERYPVEFGRAEWALSAKAFYIAKASGKFDEIHPQIFNQMHKLNKPFYKEADLINFFAQYGIDEKKYKNIVDSFSFDSMMNSGKQKVNDYPIQSVPSFVVNGKYMVNTKELKGTADFVALLNFLLTK